MLDDLLTPDDRPEGATYSDGQIKLASTFAVQARRLEQKHERGKAMRSGVLVFQPVELLACREWLLTCWHPTRTFAGAEKISEGMPGATDAIQREISPEWMELDSPSGGDLGILLMNRLALTYRATGWRLAAWHEDWELSLYVDDTLHNPEELPNLWGMMAVLRDWLNPLNRPGLRKMPDRAWLPNTNHEQVIAIDNRIDDTLEHLHALANSMRASFSVLHAQTAEEARDRKERTQHRVELIAAIFLVPTLVVGFYGANTWVPGQGRHWGFWVMLLVLLVLTSGAVATVLTWRHQERRELRRAAEERSASRQELLKAN
jgi:CorA-like Mg2+ transporter protein